jgi:glycine cleavage system protein P-like pyridoxal-binding family
MQGACLFRKKKKVSFVEKLDVLSNPMGSVPMRYDAWSYVRYKGENGKRDTSQKP